MAGIGKKELVEIIANKLNIGKNTAKESLETVLEAIEDGVAKEGKVTIIGFGVFEQKPLTLNVPIKIGDASAGTKKVKTKVIKFKAGKNFKEKIKS